MPCNLTDPGSNKCNPSAILCGDMSIHTSDSGDVRVLDSVAPLTLCVWTIDIRLQMDLAEDYLELNVTLGGGGSKPVGRCTVNSYTLLAAEISPDLSAIQPNVYVLDGSSAAQFSLIKNLRSNYIQVSYWTTNNGDINAGVTIQWSVTNPSQQTNDNMTNIVTIVAVVMVSMVCCACCLVCAYKLFKASRRRRIYLDRTEFALLYQGRRPNRRIYSQFPGQGLQPVYLTEANYESVMPKKPFEAALMEVGEPVCSICLEE